jgi:hypothetical protein
VGGVKGKARVAVVQSWAVPSEQPDPLAIALDDQPVAVMFDFVNPVWTRRDLGGACLEAVLE